MSYDLKIDDENSKLRAELDEDYDQLGMRLARRGLDINAETARASAFRIDVPTWAFVTGGTRFGRFPSPGEPRDVFEKIEDCEVVLRLVRTTPAISLHLPWDQPERPGELAAFATSRGLSVDSTNSNTFQDQPGQTHSYKFGSLSHTDRAVRRQAVEHNLECLELNATLGARAHTVWIGTAPISDRCTSGSH
jgi:L-rhamnose isomerase/sugar isomerase